MAELKAGNHLLGEARLRAETAHRHLIDAIESGIVKMLTIGMGKIIQSVHAAVAHACCARRPPRPGRVASTVSARKPPLPIIARTP